VRHIKPLSLPLIHVFTTNLTRNLERKYVFVYMQLDSPRLDHHKMVMVSEFRPALADSLGTTGELLAGTYPTA
jgi:hypothetical protein